MREIWLRFPGVVKLGTRSFDCQTLDNRCESHGLVIKFLCHSRCRLRTFFNMANIIVHKRNEMYVVSNKWIEKKGKKLNLKPQCLMSQLPSLQFFNDDGEVSIWVKIYRVGQSPKQTKAIITANLILYQAKNISNDNDITCNETRDKLATSLTLETVIINKQICATLWLFHKNWFRE